MPSKATAATCGLSKPASTKDHKDSDSTLHTGQYITGITVRGIKRDEEDLIGIGSQFDNAPTDRPSEFSLL
ncbi:uncharacterized protein FTOL_06377 [Fusarium torulosum]|uniref:Uncharacterized protein n=1 Tax=Fusarium torulosum TaxID=33205 RepID=A0AAE8M9R7_9HYPO|nr:uncharacterized protein FTOL_06377 [Fusarium torulosum]